MSARLYDTRQCNWATLLALSVYKVMFPVEADVFGGLTALTRRLFHSFVCTGCSLKFRRLHHLSTNTRSAKRWLVRSHAQEDETVPVNLDCLQIFFNHHR